MLRYLFAILMIIFIPTTKSKTIYEEIFEEVDIDEIIDNDRILDHYLRCYYDEGPCSELAEKIKKEGPEIIQTQCGQCTEKQKHILRHTLHKFIPKRPKDWERILQIFDPSGEARTKIQAFLDEEPDA